MSSEGEKHETQLTSDQYANQLAENGLSTQSFSLQQGSETYATVYQNSGTFQQTYISSYQNSKNSIKPQQQSSFQEQKIKKQQINTSTDNNSHSTSNLLQGLSFSKDQKSGQLSTQKSQQSSYVEDKSSSVQNSKTQTTILDLNQTGVKKKFIEDSLQQNILSKQVFDEETIPALKILEENIKISDQINSGEENSSFQNQLFQLLQDEDEGNYQDLFQVKRSLETQIDELKMAQSFQDDQQLAKIYIKLGRTHKIAGNYKQALQSLQTGINFIKKIDPELESKQNCKLIVQAYCWIIRTKISDGKYEQALKLCLEIYQPFAKQKIGEKNLFYTDLLHFIGISYAYNQNYQDALKLFQSSYKLQVQINQDEDKALQTYCQIMMNELKSNQLQNAKQKMHYIKAQIKKREPINRNYQLLSQIILHLGQIDKKMENYDGALANFQHCLQIRKKFFGVDHKKIVRVVSYIGEIYLKQSQFQKAQKVLVKSLAIYRQAYPQNPNKCYQILKFIGQVYIKLQRHQQALKYLLESYEKLKQVQKISHSMYGTLLLLMEKAIKTQDQVEKVKSIYQQYLQEKRNLKKGISDNDLEIQKVLLKMQLTNEKAKQKKLEQLKN